MARGPTPKEQKPVHQKEKEAALQNLRDPWLPVSSSSTRQITRKTLDLASLRPKTNPSNKKKDFQAIFFFKAAPLQENRQL